MTLGIIRIIGGTHRGRKLKVPDVTGLRPTPDRVRETLFNWLAPHIAGARCLDLFAGSGALGFEAQSRGASHVVMVDQSLVAIKVLKEEIEMLKAENIEAYQATVPDQLRPPTKPFDVVFLDPPYQHDLLIPCCFYLEENGFLAPEALIYLEAKEAIQESDLPPGWKLLKTKQAGQVAYHLAVR